MDKEKLYGFIEEPDTLTTATEEALKTVVETYPCFQTSRLLYTKYLDLVNSDRYIEELGKTAVLCGDRKKLFYLIYRESYHKLLLQPEVHLGGVKDRTEELLDSFLTSLGEDEINETRLDNGALNIVSSDYFSYLESMEEEETSDPAGERKLQHHDLIDAFIEKAAAEPLFSPYDPETGAADQKNTADDHGGEFLTETLAKIYIKQKKYEQALTIIKRLSLNFPKKSIYFADQIRFLEFLIMNERFR
ncbi:MAG: tetratricopeptide repeat protein [Porphyromonadaceae bacterium]|nr:tetratricopeptide repeat protein [Porphyromonadaceae bacterium]